MNQEIAPIDSASGMLQAEILRSILEAQGIRTWLADEAASTAIGLGFEPTAHVDIIIKESQAQHLS